MSQSMKRCSTRQKCISLSPKGVWLEPIVTGRELWVSEGGKKEPGRATQGYESPCRALSYVVGQPIVPCRSLWALTKRPSG